MKKEEEEANYDPRMISAKKTPEKSRYPIHYLVWHNKHRQLEKELGTNEQVRREGGGGGGGGAGDQTRFYFPIYTYFSGDYMYADP